jgi:hypothetical protein
MGRSIVVGRVPNISTILQQGDRCPHDLVPWYAASGSPPPSLGLAARKRSNTKITSGFAVIPRISGATSTLVLSASFCLPTQYER